MNRIAGSIPAPASLYLSGLQANSVALSKKVTYQKLDFGVFVCIAGGYCWRGLPVSRQVTVIPAAPVLHVRFSPPPTIVPTAVSHRLLVEHCRNPARHPVAWCVMDMEDIGASYGARDYRCDPSRDRGLGRMGIRWCRCAQPPVAAALDAFGIQKWPNFRGHEGTGSQTVTRARLNRPPSAAASCAASSSSTSSQS